MAWKHGFHQGDLLNESHFVWAVVMFDVMLEILMTHDTAVFIEKTKKRTKLRTANVDQFRVLLSQPHTIQCKLQLNLKFLEIWLSFRETLSWKRSCYLPLFRKSPASQVIVNSCFPLSELAGPRQDIEGAGRRGDGDVAAEEEVLLLRPECGLQGPCSAESALRTGWQITGCVVLL